MTENLRKFLESDDPAMVRMGLSMAKGAELEIIVKDLENLLQHENIEIVKIGFEFAMENKRKEAIEAIPKFLLSEDPAMVKIGLSAAKDLDTKDNKLVIWVLSYFYGNSEAKEIVKNDPFYLGEDTRIPPRPPTGVRAGSPANWQSILNTIESICDTGPSWGQSSSFSAFSSQSKTSVILDKESTADNVSERVQELIFTRMIKDLRTSPFYGTDFIDIMGILADATDMSLTGHINKWFGPPECPNCGMDSEWEIEDDYCTNPDCEDEGEVEVVLPNWLLNYLYD